MCTIISIDNRMDRLYRITNYAPYSRKYLCIEVDIRVKLLQVFLEFYKRDFVASFMFSIVLIVFLNSVVG